MGRNPTAKRVTRREAVALIGAGAVFGTRPKAARARERVQGRGPCDYDATVDEQTRSGPPPHTKIMFVNSCCSETKNAILAGVAHPQTKPTQAGQKHLKPLQDKLDTVALAEYVYMIWGLTGGDVERLNALIPKELGIDISKK